MAVSTATHRLPAVVGPAIVNHGRLAGAKTRAVSLPVVASTAVTCAVGALLPPVPGLALFTTGLLIAGALIFGAVEPLAVRLLYGGSPLTAADQRVLAPVLTVVCPHGLGPPLVDIWVRPNRLTTDVTATGRRSVLVTRGLLETISSGATSVERATVLMAREAGVVRTGATRFDPVLRFWTIPWVLLTVGIGAVMHCFGVVAAVRLMWRTRGLVAVIAVVQAVSADHVGLAVMVMAIGVASSLWPRWVRAWQARLAEIGDAAVARVGASAPSAERGPARGSRHGPAAANPGGCASSSGRHLSVVR